MAHNHARFNWKWPDPNQHVDQHLDQQIDTKTRLKICPKLGSGPQRQTQLQDLAKIAPGCTHNSKKSVRCWPAGDSDSSPKTGNGPFQSSFVPPSTFGVDHVPADLPNRPSTSTSKSTFSCLLPSRLDFQVDFQVDFGSTSRSRWTFKGGLVPCRPCRAICQAAPSQPVPCHGRFFCRFYSFGRSYCFGGNNWKLV